MKVEAMSDTEKPQESPAPSVQERTQALRLRMETRAEAAMQQPKLEPPPNLTDEQVLGAGPRLRDLDAQIERELQEAMGGISDKELYGEPAQQKGKPPPSSEPGKKKAKVIAVHGTDVFLDVPGGRSQGVLPMLQFAEGPPAIGTEVEISIEGYDPANGLLILSRRGAATVANWSSVAVDMIVEARVTATNKGGLSVDVNGIRGFMPISQIDLYRVEDLEQFVNQRLRCMVAEVNPEERNLVVSRRALLEKERELAREKLWAELAEGQIREGVVRSVLDFGAFVDLGGVDGLLHISQMSWARVDDANRIVQPGQTVKVVVLKIDHETRKVGLGLRQLTASPWEQADTNYPMHAVVKGKVTRLMEFGAFVELEPGIEGLVHVSELAPQRVRRPSDVVQPGQEVQVMVLGVDRNQKRISLSLKAVTAKEAEAAEEEGEEVEVHPQRPRMTPLRGGLGEH
ncbi:MAG TPA: S1 RNA-binding domain-containing protein [Gemmataceae bacterium]|nr:S1 RNA-binding domain-containing protein [Gemmataceae bacterium]